MQVYARFEDIEQEIIRLISAAKESVRICVAWINGNSYRAVLQRLLAANVRVEVIYNNDAINSALTFPTGVLTYPIRARRSSAMMHNKFCIIDDEVVISGSFNWSRNASASFENIVVVQKNYPLVAAFLNEFYDLISFYDNPSTIKRCTRCGSFEYRLGIFGEEIGLYSESLFHIWSICAKNRHVQLVTQHYEHYLGAQLGFLDDEDQDDWMQEPTLDKLTMQKKFKRARSEMQRTRAYFTQRGVEVHALGAVVVENQNDVLKYDAPEDRSVHIYWRDMHYRKIVPIRLDEDSEDISKLMDESS